MVFLGPCIAKKKESMDLRHNDCIDAVLNFQEVESWLKQEQIEIQECEAEPLERIDPKVNRLYPVTNGVVNSVLATEKQVDHYRKFYVHGIRNALIYVRAWCGARLTAALSR